MQHFNHTQLSLHSPNQARRQRNTKRTSRLAFRYAIWHM